MKAIPRHAAWELCNRIREDNRGKWYSPALWQCWGCVKFSKGDISRMCFSNKDGYRGCGLVNRRYDRDNP